MDHDARKPNFIVWKEVHQPAYRHTLISVFAVYYLESIVVKLVSCKIIIVWLVFVSVMFGLTLTQSGTPKTDFLL